MQRRLEATAQARYRPKPTGHQSNAEHRRCRNWGCRTGPTKSAPRRIISGYNRRVLRHARRSQPTPRHHARRSTSQAAKKTKRAADDLSPIKSATSRGTTLVELMVAIMTGLVILSALTMVIITTMHGSARVTRAGRSDAAGADRARAADGRAPLGLRHARKSRPVREGSEGNSLRFIHQTGSEVQPTPVDSSVVSYSGGTLTQTDYEVDRRHGARLGPSRRRRQLDRGPCSPTSAPTPAGSSIFSYYRYASGDDLRHPAGDAAEATEAADSRSRSRRRSPPRPNTRRSQTPAPRREIQNSATLRLTPPSFNEGSPSPAMP